MCIRDRCDVVEFHAAPEGVPLAGEEGRWLPFPVEYKRGRPKPHQADELQLCAQATVSYTHLDVYKRQGLSVGLLAALGGAAFSLGIAFGGGAVSGYAALGGAAVGQYAAGGTAFGSTLAIGRDAYSSAAGLALTLEQLHGCLLYTSRCV